MSSEWCEVRLSEVIEVTDYVANGSFAALKENVTYQENGYAILARLVDHNAGWEGPHVFVNEAAYKFLSKSSLEPGDIVIANVGANAGTVFRIPFLRKPVTLGPNAVRVRPKKEALTEIDSDYLYYYLDSPVGQEKLQSLITGSAQPKFNKTALRGLSLEFPEISHQKSIARIMLAIDDRIALLRETNATLEAIAQALFKSWFVDFDPVRAKMEGRAPEGMDETTAALFPDLFEETELGVVPRGWSIQPIGDLVEAVGGSTPDTKNEAFWEPAIHHWTSPKDLSGATAPVLLDSQRKISEAGLAKITSGLLPVGTLLMSSRAPIGYLSLSHIPIAINQGYIAMLPGGRLPPAYLYFWCQLNMEVIKGRANGSTFMEISKKAFRPIPVLVPPTEIVDRFNDFATTMFSRMAATECQAHSLVKLRDILLPRLISGNLRIPEIHTHVEEALV